MAEGNGQSIFISSAKKSKLETFEEVYQMYYEKICRYLMNYIQDRDKVEDITQETFLTYWDKHQVIEVNTSLKSYLFRMAYNKMIDSYRSSSRKTAFLQEYYHTAVMLAEDKPDEYKEDKIKQLHKCIGELPLRSREVFMESKFSNKTNKEVSQFLKISVKTVEGHISKAYKYIKNCLEGITSYNQ